jgi:hypothetical protein
MPNTQRNAHVLARALDERLRELRRSRADAADMAGISRDTLYRILRGEITSRTEGSTLEGLDRAADWATGECSRILARKEDEPEVKPVDHLEVASEIMQAHLATLKEGLEIIGREVTGDESREQVQRMWQSISDVMFDVISRQTGIPPGRHKPDDSGNDAPRTNTSPGAFRLSGL